MVMAKDRQQRLGGWLFHLVIWAILLALPFFSLLPGRPIMDGQGYLHFVVVLLSFMLVFYVNWFLLIPRYLFRRQIGLYLLWNLALIVLATLFTHLVFRYLLPVPEMSGMRRGADWPVWVETLRFFLGNAGLYTLVVLIAVAVRMTGEWYKAESLRKDLEKSKTEAELQNLKSQLNPHFLFNTLNNIYSLIQIDGDRAQAAVHDLGQLLRYVLYDSSRPTVPVQKEMGFLRDYIALMKIRLPRLAELSVDLPENPSSREIAPMLFISPIENAFKHGVSNEAPSFIRITLRETAGSVVCDIANSNFPKADDDRSGSGIGIRNLEQRLEMIYPGRYTFTHGASEGVYTVHLEIPL